MPYTPSHISAVLWMKSRRYSLRALIIGSISPDLEHLVRLSPVSYYGHSPWGLVLFCLPMGCVFWVLFEVFWKKPLIAIFKEVDFSYSKPSSLKIAISLLIGASTHLLWDSFTHHGRMGAEFLKRELLFFADVNFSPNLLQHLSTVFGAWVVASFLVNSGVPREKVIRLTVFQALLYLNLYFVNFHSNTFFSVGHIVHTANDLLILNLFLLTTLGFALKTTKRFPGLSDYIDKVVNGGSVEPEAA